jgi:hypothetical protein
MKFVPGAIDLTLPVDIYTEKTVEVPLRGINFPADKVLRAFPSKVQIIYTFTSFNRFGEYNLFIIHVCSYFLFKIFHIVRSVYNWLQNWIFFLNRQKKKERE